VDAFRATRHKRQSLAADLGRCLADHRQVNSQNHHCCCCCCWAVRRPLHPTHPVRFAWHRSLINSSRNVTTAYSVSPLGVLTTASSDTFGETCVRNDGGMGDLYQGFPPPSLFFLTAIPFFPFLPFRRIFYLTSSSWALPRECRGETINEGISILTVEANATSPLRNRRHVPILLSLIDPSVLVRGIIIVVIKSLEFYVVCDTRKSRPLYSLINA